MSDGNTVDADSDSSLQDGAAFDGPAEVGSQDGTPEGGSACPGGCVVLFGGRMPSTLNDTWTFDGTSWTQQACNEVTPSYCVPNTGPATREGADMATLGNEVVLWGGLTLPTSLLGDMWTFNGAGTLLGGTYPWSNVSQGSVVPQARVAAAMATLGNEIVLFGGQGESTIGSPVYLSDTWTFDGTNWTQVVSNASPVYLGVMATLGNEAVLFGSTDTNQNPLNETWTFDGTSWTQVAVSNAPAGGGAMATLGNEVVFFGGGTAANDTPLNETWTFNGTDWTQVSVSNPPPPRLGPTMATLGNGVVLFGGSSNDSDLSSSFLNDTWIFDGTSWTQVSVSNPPPARASAAMATLP